MKQIPWNRLNHQSFEDFQEKSEFDFYKQKYKSNRQKPLEFRKHKSTRLRQTG